MFAAVKVAMFLSCFLVGWLVNYFININYFSTNYFYIYTICASPHMTTAGRFAQLFMTI